MFFRKKQTNYWNSFFWIAYVGAHSRLMEGDYCRLILLISLFNILFFAENKIMCVDYFASNVKNQSHKYQFCCVTTK